MKIGYPCVNYSIGYTTNSTFRISSYSPEKLIDKVTHNLQGLIQILKFNVKHKFLFFRIGSSFIPFASHRICVFDWKKYFKNELRKIGNYIKKNAIRISMHPDQFVLINSLDKKILTRSINELQYHVDLLDAMELDASAKIQIHVGGVYGNKAEAMRRFIKRYHDLPDNIKKRLVIENDDYLYHVQDCWSIYQETQIPILLDIFHHHCLNQGEPVREVIEQCITTWRKKDGLPLIDYSQQQKGARKGTHINHINTQQFKKFIKEAKGLDFDIMLEIKDKEKSARLAQNILQIKAVL